MLATRFAQRKQLFGNRPTIHTHWFLALRTVRQPHAARARGSSASRRGQRLRQIVAQIALGLEPHADADQAVADAERSREFPRGWSRGSSAPDARSATPRRPGSRRTRRCLHARQQARARPAVRRAPRRRSCRPARAICVLGQRVLRVRRRGPGSTRARPRRAPPGSWPARCAVRQWRSMRTGSVFTPRSTRKQSNGEGTAPIAFCRKRSCVGQRVVAGQQRAAHHVAVPVEVLGGGVHHDVGAERERPLQHGRGEGVVDDQLGRRARA